MLYQRELRSRTEREILIALGHDSSQQHLPVRPTLAVPIPHLVDRLLDGYRGSEIRPVEPLAAALVEIHYASCFAVPESMTAEAERVIRGQPIPAALLSLFGDRLEKRSVSTRKLPWKDLLPLAVFHSFVRDHSGDLESNVGMALELANDASRRLTWSVQTNPVILRTAVDGRDPLQVTPSPLARQAHQERLARVNQERLGDDPARNNRPEEFLKLPRPELADQFTWWSLQVGNILGSPLLDEARYVAVAYELAERCLKTMPNACAQAREKATQMREENPDYSDRFGSVHNESLPKLARWLIKRGDFKLAEQVCNSALEHRIEAASPGALERALAASQKKRLAAAKPTVRRRETP